MIENTNAVNKHLLLERNNKSIIGGIKNTEYIHEYKTKRSNGFFRKYLKHEEQYKSNKYNILKNSKNQNIVNKKINHDKHHCKNIYYNDFYKENIYSMIIDRINNNITNNVYGYINFDIDVTSESYILSPSFDYFRIMGNHDIIETHCNLYWHRNIKDIFNGVYHLKGYIYYKFIGKSCNPKLITYKDEFIKK